MSTIEEAFLAGFIFGACVDLILFGALIILGEVLVRKSPTNGYKYLGDWK